MPGAEEEVTGSCIMHYPSGRVAVNVVATEEGRLTTCLADDDTGAVLCLFDGNGRGSTCFPSGSPQLVVSSKGWSLSDQQGNIIKNDEWPHPPASKIELQLDEHFSVCFVDRGDNKIFYVDFEGTRHVLQCGEQFKRTSSHLDKVVGRVGGKLELDIKAIRKEPTIYVPPGPHSKVTIRPGLGALKGICQKLDKESGVQGIIAEMDELQARVGKMATLKLDETISHRTTALESTTAALRSSIERPKPKPYTSRRERLRSVRATDLDAYVSSSDHAGNLTIVCCVADWQPVCRKLLPALQGIKYRLTNDPEFKALFHPYRIDIVKVDVTDSLMKRYNILMIPMCLVFFQGKLLHWSNDLGSKDTFVAEMTQASTLAAKQVFLPTNFKFSPADNSLFKTFSKGSLSSF